jgi:hypothetical protein
MVNSKSMQKPRKVHMNHTHTHNTNTHTPMQIHKQAWESHIFASQHAIGVIQSHHQYADLCTIGVSLAPGEKGQRLWCDREISAAVLQNRNGNALRTRKGASKVDSEQRSAVSKLQCERGTKSFFHATLSVTLLHHNRYFITPFTRCLESALEAAVLRLDLAVRHHLRSCFTCYQTISCVVAVTFNQISQIIQPSSVFSTPKPSIELASSDGVPYIQ